jgi:hypothetical protein
MGMVTDTMTVEEWLIEELWGRGLRTSECEQALAFAKKKLDDLGFQDNAHLEGKHKNKVLVRHCWNTLADDYSQEVLEDLRDRIEHHTFTWLVNQLRSRL